MDYACQKPWRVTDGRDRDRLDERFLKACSVSVRQMIPSEAVGLYIHVPFCRRRCHFCAFYLEIAQPNRIVQFQSALLQEIALHAQHDVLDGRRLQSIYFGGGTPTSLPTEYLTRLLNRIRATWPISPSAEITIEAHFPPSAQTISTLSSELGLIESASERNP